jgi:hypothetical protein
MFRFYFTDINGENEFELDYVIDVVGLGIAPSEITHVNRGYRADGTVVTNIRYSPRPFTVQFNIHDPNAVTQMRELGKYFANNIARSFWVQNDSEEPKCLTPVYLNDAVDFDVTESPLKPMLMSFVAPDPWFKKFIPFTSEGFEEPLLEFDLFIPAEGVEFSATSAQRSKINNGDKWADAIIRFIGGADNPYVSNTTTGERLVVERTIPETSTLEINSATGRVDIIDYDGTRHNAFNYIGDDDDLIHLAQGNNEITFGAGSTEGYMEVSAIEYYATV